MICYVHLHRIHTLSNLPCIIPADIALVVRAPHWYLYTANSRRCKHTGHRNCKRTSVSINIRNCKSCRHGNLTHLKGSLAYILHYVIPIFCIGMNPISTRLLMFRYISICAIGSVSPQVRMMPGQIVLTVLVSPYRK